MLALIMTQIALAASLTTTPVVMTGGVSEWTRTVRSSDAQPISVGLTVRASDRLDPDDSSVSLLLNDVPIRTLTVAQLTQDGTVPIVLPELTDGFHRLTVRTHLEVLGDPCDVQDPAVAWLVIDPASTLQGVSVGSVAGSVADTVASWFDGTPVQVQAPVGSPVRAEAIVEAAQWVVQRGGRPTADAADRLVLRDHVDASVPGLILQHLDQDPAVRGMVAAVDGDIWVVARHPDELSTVLHTASAPGFAQACTLSVCAVGRSAALAPVVVDPADATVWTGEQAWGTRGQTVQGRGRHVTRFTVPRQSLWEVSAAPTVVIDATVPHHQVVDGDASSAVLSLMGRPIASWSLDGPATSRRWVARIPPALWDAPEWSFELAITLESAAGEACSAEDDSDVFVVIEPTSRVEVVRVERRVHGLSAFARASQTERPSIRYDDTLDLNTWVQAGVLLTSIAKQTPQSAWRVADQDHAHQVHLNRPTESWLDVGQWASLPLLPAASSPMMMADTCAGGLCTRLDVSIGLDAQDLVVPDLTQMHVAGAVWSEQWVVLEGDDTHAERVAIGLGGDPDPQRVQPQIEQASAARVNLMTAGVLFLVLLLGSAWVWRGQSVAKNQANA